MTTTTTTTKTDNFRRRDENYDEYVSHVNGVDKHSHGDYSIPKIH